MQRRRRRRMSEWVARWACMSVPCVLYSAYIQYTLSLSLIERWICGMKHWSSFWAMNWSGTIGGPRCVCITNPTNPLFFSLFSSSFACFCSYFSTISFFYIFIRLLDFIYTNSMKATLPSTNLSVTVFISIYLVVLFYYTYHINVHLRAILYITRTLNGYISLFVCVRLRAFRMCLTAISNSFVSIQTWSLYLLAKCKPNIMYDPALAYDILSHLPEEQAQRMKNQNKCAETYYMKWIKQFFFSFNICFHNDLCVCVCRELYAMFAQKKI